MATKQVKVPDYTPSERQTKFHTSIAFETLYGGAAGGGKTAALVAEAITYALQYPKSRVYIFRRTTPELKQSVVPEFFKQTADYMNIAKGVKFNSQDSVFIFTNGSIIQLAYLETNADMYRYQSAEIHLLLFDELTHFTKEQYEFMKTRVRSGAKLPLKIMAATNPGGIGHAWVKSYFIDIAAPETLYTDDDKNTRIFIPAKVTDHVSKDFIESYSKVLDSISDPNLRRAYRDGDWDIFAGQAFEEWKREVDGKPYHVIAPFQIPSHWTKWMAYDYGYNTYAAGVWIAADPITNRMILYREFYETKMTTGKQAEVMHMMESGEQITMHLADPSIWKAVGNAETGELIAKIFQNHGLNFQPANNDRKAGKAAVHEALAAQADGLPRLQVFSSCVNFLRTFPNLPVDINRPEDIDTRAEDHLYDALRYAIMNQRPTMMPEIKFDQSKVNARERYTGRM